MIRLAIRAAATAASLAVAASAGAATPKDTLVVAATLDNFMTLDPAGIGEVFPDAIMNNVCDPLLFMDYDDPSNLVPGLAERWEVSDDAKTYTFHLRKGLTFPESGNPVTAHDAQWTYRRNLALNLNDAINFKEWGFTAENAEASFVALDDHTLQVNVSEAWAPSSFKYLWTGRSSFVLDSKEIMKHAVDGDLGNKWLTDRSACYGPFSLATWKVQDVVILQRNGGEDWYWRHPVAMKRIVFRHIPEPAAARLLLEKGDADVALTVGVADMDAVRKHPDLRLVNILRHRMNYFALNQKDPILSNPKVVEAFKYLVDYEGMANTVLKDAVVVRQSMVPIGAFGALPESEKPYRLDLEKARQLITEAGYPDGFATKMAVPSRYPYPLYAQHIAENAAQIGIDIELEQSAYSHAGGTLVRSRKHVITVKGWGTGRPDADAMAGRHAWNPDNSDEANVTMSPAWRSGWETGPELNALVERARMTTDTDARRDMYHEIQRIQLATSPLVYMFQRVRNVAVRKEVTRLEQNGFKYYFATARKE